MCFGSKDNAGEEEAPRPAQHRQQQPQMHHQQPAHGGNFAPPRDPPPSQKPLMAVGPDEIAPPPGPPPSHRVAAGDDYAPPPGPPPSHNRAPAADDFAPPPGPPPSHQRQATQDEYAPPPGPPPSSRPHDDLSYIAPPPGPPPAESKGTKPQHDWEALVPDTSLFPPPPSFFSGFDRSPAHNATEAEAEAGERWCAEHPLTAPIALDSTAVTALHAHDPRLMQPQGFRGTLVWTAPGTWKANTDSRAADSTMIAYPPLYAVTLHSPLAPANAARPAKTIYYEVQLSQHGNPRAAGDICLALGYTALPYPSFRMPGWHRASLAVHGDDGHRFINDRWGGKAFTTPFARGERLGIGMTFSVVDSRIETDVFFTRQGREVGRWNLHEETDAEQDLPVTGLEGYHDLSCAIGTSGQTDFEVLFDPARWLFRPVGY